MARKRKKVKPGEWKPSPVLVSLLEEVIAFFLVFAPLVVMAAAYRKVSILEVFTQ